MRKRFAQFTWVVLGFNLLVIVWGALVRASKSGEGCGNHWPLCNGTVVPHAPQIATIIEFTHRVSTGLAFLGVVAIAIWAWRARLSRPTVRMAIASLVLIVTEALLGAGLVLFKYAGSDSSPGRAVYLSAHLINTQLLIGAIALAAWYGSGHGPINWRGLNSRPLTFALVALLVVSITGAITALGDTLYPVSSLRAGFAADISGTAPMLLRLRIWHPVIAAAASFYIAAIAMSLGGKRVVLLVLAQVAAGLLNLSLLAPIWMQLLHLLFADLLWISLVLLTASVLVEQPTLRTELQSNIIPR